MAENVKPEIILYDLACIKNVCFSPYVWRIRLMLNYKRIPYETKFLEFPDIAPTLAGLGLQPGIYESQNKYTVPVIQHIPTDTHIVDSTAIAQFLESTYPSPPLPLTSSLGRQIEARMPGIVATAVKTSVVPRQTQTLSPRAQEYHKSKWEARLGHPIEDLIAGDNEENAWAAAADDLRAVGEMLLTHKADGPFILGDKPSYTDFIVAGVLQCARTVDEGVFQKAVGHPGFGEVYSACRPYIEQKMD